MRWKKRRGKKKKAGLRAGSDRLSGRNNDLDSKKHSATPLAPAVHWGTDHAVYCFYQICPNLCMCVFSLLFHLLIWLICPILSLFLVAIFFCFSFRSSVHVYVCVFMHSCRQSEKLCHAALLGGSTVPDCCLKHTRTSHSTQTLLPGSTPLCLSVTVTHAQTKMCKTECQNLSTNNTSTQVHRICFVFAVIQIFISTEVVWLPWCRL